ncbi:MAG: 16S rRNA (uracil(1498)-N(3))-methyltransferase [Syntrophales bacterium]|nr:16S rRNA (uracil(1498)-N(3))-methyltransferase [Syntrophales bacterium]
MTIPRLYFPEKVEKGDRRVLDRENLNYLKSVLRMKSGDRLFLFDGAGCESEALILDFTARGVSVEIVKKEEEKTQDKAVSITLFQALPKANKMDSIVRKGTELGADAIIPFHSARSIPRLSPETALLKTSRWRKIAAEATRQCGRSRMPEIGKILSLFEVLEYSPGGGLRIIFWEGETETGLRQVLRDERHEGIKEFVLVVGPEGGFLREEVDMATAGGFISVGLGRQILKVETASLAILSILQYEKGIFNSIGEGI